MRLNADQKLWIETLKTTDKKQGRSELHNTKTDSWCCLGVAADLFVDTEDREVGRYGHLETFEGAICVAPESVVERLKLRNFTGEFECNYQGFISLTDMNDRGKTFKEIAAFIEAHPEQVFTGA